MGNGKHMETYQLPCTLIVWGKRISLQLKLNNPWVPASQSKAFGKVLISFASLLAKTITVQDSSWTSCADLSSFTVCLSVCRPSLPQNVRRDSLNKLSNLNHCTQSKGFHEYYFGRLWHAHRYVWWVDRYLTHGVEKESKIAHMSVLGVIGQAYRYMIELVCTYMYKIQL